MTQINYTWSLKLTFLTGKATSDIDSLPKLQVSFLTF